MKNLKEIISLNDSISYLIEQIDKTTGYIKTATTIEDVHTYERMRDKYYESLDKCFKKMEELI